jgi:hypothetical protein
VTIHLSVARTARLFTDLSAQQQALPSKQHPVPLPPCPACHHRSSEITLKADGTSIRFANCAHIFSLTREAFLAGLAAQRAV